MGLYCNSNVDHDVVVTTNKGRCNAECKQEEIACITHERTNSYFKTDDLIGKTTAPTAFSFKLFTNGNIK